MDYSKVMLKYYPQFSWSCGETYESLKWNDKTEHKPTKEHLESLWNDVLKDNMRKERKKLLKDSDIMMLSDYPHNNKEAWVSYRQELRTLPETWVEGTPFPSPPE